MYIVDTEDIEYDDSEKSGEYPLNTYNDRVDEIINTLEYINQKMGQIIHDKDEKNDQ